MRNLLTMLGYLLVLFFAQLRLSKIGHARHVRKIIRSQKLKTTNPNFTALRLSQPSIRHLKELSCHLEAQKMSQIGSRMPHFFRKKSTTGVKVVSYIPAS